MRQWKKSKERAWKERRKQGDRVEWGVDRLLDDIIKSLNEPLLSVLIISKFPILLFRFDQYF